jgi:hypothetical protein
MVLSISRRRHMTYLSDTARVVLAAAAQRADLSVLPFPEGCKAKGGAERKVLSGLKKRGLIRVLGADGGPQRVVITSEGMAAIGVETEDDAEVATRAGDTPAPAAEGDGEPTAAETEPDAAATRTPRAGTKQAMMIEMLKRPEGATVEQIAEATGWQKHTIRGAISGALKKKLGLTVETTRTRESGPDKTGAKGSSTVYRITGSSVSTA